MSIIVGLTGGIGSGKSIVAKIFATMGVPVLDADALAKDIMNSDPFVREQLIAQFGPEVYTRTLDQQYQLNRSFLSQIVFSDSYQLEVLNAIVHPVTIQAAKDWAIAQKAPYIIKEAALFFESGSSEGVAKIIGVAAPKSLRIHRVMQRDACSKQEVEKRMANQIEPSLKMKLCDWVIVNDDQQLLVPQVLSIHKKIMDSIK